MYVLAYFEDMLNIAWSLQFSKKENPKQRELSEKLVAVTSMVYFNVYCKTSCIS